MRIDRVALGNLGDVKRLTRNVSELKVNYGPGYRLYFTQHGPVVIVLLCGGDKTSQASDIRRAESIARELGGK